MGGFMEFFGFGQDKKRTESKEALHKSSDSLRYREPHTTAGKKHKGGKKIVDKVAKPFRQCMPFPLPKGSKKSDRLNAGHTNNRVNTIAASSHDAEISPDSGCCISSDDDDTPQPPHQGTTVAKIEHDGGKQTTPNGKPANSTAITNSSSAARIGDGSLKTQADIRSFLSFDQTTPVHGEKVAKPQGSQLPLAAVTVMQDKYYEHKDSENLPEDMVDMLSDRIEQTESVLPQPADSFSLDLLFLIAEKRSVSYTLLPTSPAAMTALQPNNSGAIETAETVEIKKLGYESWTDEKSGSVFEETVESTNYPTGTVLKITRYGRNSWRAEDSCLFQKLPIYRERYQAIPLRSVQRTLSHEEFIKPTETAEIENSDEHSLTHGNQQMTEPNDGALDDVNKKTLAMRDQLGYQEINNSVNRNVPMKNTDAQDRKGTMPSYVSLASNIIDSPVDSESIVSKATTVSHKPIKLLKNVPISPHRSQPDQSQSCHDETSREENNEGSVMEFADDRTDVDLPQAETVDEFSNLQKSDAITESPTDLDDLMDDIARICDSCETEIVAPSYLQHWEDPRRILLQGPNLKLVEEPILQLVNKKYPNYSEPIVSEKKPEYFTDEGYPVYTRDLVDTQKPPPRIPYYLQIERRESWHQSSVHTHKNHSTCGVFFRAGVLPYKNKAGVDQAVPEKVKELRECFDPFTITSYHALFFNGEERTLAACDDEQEYAEWKKLVGDFKTEMMPTLKPHNYQGLPIKGTPYGNFRYFIPQTLDVEQHNKFMADEVFLRTSEKELTSRGWIWDRLQSHVNFTPVGEGSPGTEPIPICGILPIKEPGDIGRLINVRIWCAGACGTIRQHPTTIERKVRDQEIPEVGSTKVKKMKIAHHIAFTLEGPRFHGNSGAPVYVYDEVEKCMYIIGILKGSWEYDDQFGYEDIYQAIALYPAIERIKCRYHNYIRGIRLECTGDVENSLMKKLVPSLAKTDDDTGYFGSIQPPSIQPRSSPPRINHQVSVDNGPSTGGTHTPSLFHQPSAQRPSALPVTPPGNIAPLEGPPNRPSTLPTQTASSKQGAPSPHDTRSLSTDHRRGMHTRSKSSGPVPVPK